MKILVIGDALLDWYTYVKSTRQSPEQHDARVWDVQEYVESPGGALNVAANLAALRGHTIDFSGIVDAETSANLLEDYKIHVVPDLSLFTVTPLVKERLVDVDSGKQVARIDNRKKFDDDESACFAGKYLFEFQDKEWLAKYDAIVVSDYDKGTVTQPVIDALKSYSGIVFVDTKKQNLDVWNGLPNCILKINKHEVDRSVGGENLKIIVTLGSVGALYFDKAVQKLHIPAVPITDADVVGAGDSYLAGLVDGYLYSNEISTAMRCAELVARASVQKKGTGIVYARDIGQSGQQQFA